MGDAAPPLLLSSILGGFIALHLCHFTQRRWEAQEWERNLFEATALGASLFLLVRTLLSPVEEWRWVSSFVDWLGSRLPFPYPGSVLVTIAGGVALGLLGRRFMSPTESVRRVADSYGGEMLRLFIHAAQDRLPVMLTLRSGKVYVGFVIVAPGIQAKRHHVKILPTLSGYRGSEDHRVRFTTPYWSVYEALVAEGGASRPPGSPAAQAPLDHAMHRGFGLVVPMSEIVTAGQFDVQIYDQHFSRPA